MVIYKPDSFESHLDQQGCHTIYIIALLEYLWGKKKAAQLDIALTLFICLTINGAQERLLIHAQLVATGWI